MRQACHVACGCSIGMLLVLGGLPQQVAMAPADVLRKTDLRAIDFVGQLIEVGVPAGIEVLGGSGFSDRDVIAPFGGGRLVSIAQVIDAFNRRHRESRAEWRDDVVVIRPIQDRSWLLDADVSLRSEKVVDVQEGIQVVLSELDSSELDSNVKRSGVRTRSGVSSVLMPAGPNGPLYTPAMLGPITIPSGRMTVVAALNAIVRQLKGHAWVLMTEKQLGSTVVSWVGVLRREGWLVKIAFTDPKRPRV